MDTVATKTKMDLGMYAYSKSSIEEISRIRKRNSFNADVGTGDESDAGAQETTPILEQQKKRFGTCGLAWSIAVKSIERTWSSNRQVPALQHPHVRETGNDKVNAARCNSTPCSIHVLPRFLVLALAKCANIPPLATDRDEVDLRLSPDIHPVIFPFPLHQRRQTPRAVFESARAMPASVGGTPSHRAGAGATIQRGHCSAARGQDGETSGVSSVILLRVSTIASGYELLFKFVRGRSNVLGPHGGPYP